MALRPTPTAAIMERITARLEIVRRTATDVSRACGGVHVIPNIKRGSLPSLEIIEDLARELETTPEFLAFGVAADDTPARLIRPDFMPVPSVPILGEVAAGYWREVDTAIDESPYHGIPVPPDPAYPIEHQFAVIARGTSVNRIAPDGAVMSCVYTEPLGITPRNGALVIAQQTRADGQEIMRTAKRYKATQDGIELWPDSDDPKWREPIRISRGGEDSTTCVTILGLVTWVHKPLDRPDLPFNTQQT